MKTNQIKLMATTVALGLSLAGCGGDTAKEDASGGRPGASGHGAPGAKPSGEAESAAVPVEVAAVARRTVASYIQTNGTLEAENDVVIVSRTQGPIVELLTEEGRRVAKGQVMARVDSKETHAQVKIAEVALREMERAFQRAEDTYEEQLISQADFDAALAARESAEATLVDRQVQLDYTEIRAPFSAIVVDRNVRLGDNVTVNQILFRISDFDPLLCKIQVPEKELPRLRKGQPAYLTVEAWPDERFPAKVLRLSPVVDATTGTIRVTLVVQARARLRPGMFASIYLEIDRHENALTIPKSALSLESLGDTVYVVNDGVAGRRPIELGFEEADLVEVASGLDENDRVIVVGQDGLSDGTPIRILEGPGAEGEASGRAQGTPPGRDGAPEGEERQRPAATAVDTQDATPGGGARPTGRRSPPPQALAACEGKAEGDACSFTTRRGEMDGTCQPRPDASDQVSCRPSGFGGPGGGRPDARADSGS